MASGISDAVLLFRVYEKGSFRAAADELGADQGTISRKIAALEERVGAKLFTRGKKGVEPTQAGRILLEASERTVATLEAFDRTIKRISTQNQEHIRVTAPISLISFILAPAFNRTLPSQHPHSAIAAEIDWAGMPRVSFSPASAAAAQIDLRWTSFNRAPAHKEDEVVRRIGTVEFVPLASGSYLSRLDAKISFSDLHQHPMIEHSHQRLDPGFAPWNQELDKATLGPVAVMPCTASILPLVACGTGIGLLPRMFTQLEHGLEIACLDDAPYLARDLWISAAPESLKQANVRRVFDTVVSLLSRWPWVDRRSGVRAAAPAPEQAVTGQAA